MIIKSCRLRLNARDPRDFPRDGFPQIAFMGASNVGKSRLLNRLLGVRGLARTSKTPGRTRDIRFYTVNEKIYFVDLPGYGYARVPGWMRQGWRGLIEAYLDGPAGPDLSILLVDARREPSDRDLQLIDWLRSRRARYQVVLTKNDKLSRSQSLEALSRAVPRLGLRSEQELLAVSAVAGDGIPALWRAIDDAIVTRRQTSRGVSPPGGGSLDTDRSVAQGRPRGSLSRQ